MKKEFLPYNLALKLKELGFDNRNLGFSYMKFNCEGVSNATFEKVVPNYLYNNYDLICTAPLWQQAFDYFREKGYESEINRNIPEMEKQGYKKYSFYIWSEHINPRGNYTDRKLNSTETYEEARQDCLIKLIEICQIQNL